MYVIVVDLEGGIPYVFTQLAKDLPHLESMTLFMDSGKVKRLPPSITVFGNLKFLDVIMVLFKEEYDLLWITSILNGCPLLQKLHLMLFPEENYIHQREIKKSNGSPHDQLREVQISDFTANWNQIELATYFLNNSVALDQMVIKPSVRVFCGSDRWENFDAVVPWTDCQRAMLLQMLQVEVWSNAKLLIL